MTEDLRRRGGRFGSPTEDLRRRGVRFGSPTEDLRRRGESNGSPTEDLRRRSRRFGSGARGQLHRRVAGGYRLLTIASPYSEVLSSVAPSYAPRMLYGVGRGVDWQPRIDGMLIAYEMRRRNPGE